MADNALAALYRAVRARLTAGTETWGDRVGLEFLSAAGGERIPYPYVVYALAGGGVRRDTSLIPDLGHEYRLDLMVVSDTFSEAAQGAFRLEELFEGQGSQDVRIRLMGTALDAGSDWEIVCSDQEPGASIAINEVDMGRHTWALGATYRFRMYPK